jgi:hypothetical protein
MSINPSLYRTFPISSPDVVEQKITIDKANPTIAYSCIVTGSTPKIRIKRWDISGETANLLDYEDIIGNGTYSAGHCQSLEVYHGNNGTYLIIVTKGQTVKKDTSTTTYTKFATQLTKVVYTGDQQQHVYTEFPRIGALNHVGSTSIAGGVRRVEFALSSSEAKLAVMVFDKNDEMYSELFDMATIDSLFTQAGAGGEVSITAPIKSHAMGGTESSLFGGSFQGLELADNDVLYTSSGSATQDSKIRKFRFGGRLPAGTVVSDPSWPNSEVETEGIQLYGSNVYIGYSKHENGKTVANWLYSAPKADF